MAGAAYRKSSLMLQLSEPEQMADDLVGYGLPTLSRVAPPRPPVLKAAEPHRDETPEKNYGADINTLIRLLEEGRL